MSVRSLFSALHSQIHRSDCNYLLFAFFLLLIFACIWCSAMQKGQTPRPTTATMFNGSMLARPPLLRHFHALSKIIWRIGRVRWLWFLVFTSVIFPTPDIISNKFSNNHKFHLFVYKKMEWTFIFVNVHTDPNWFGWPHTPHMIHRCWKITICDNK